MNKLSVEQTLSRIEKLPLLLMETMDEQQLVQAAETLGGNYDPVAMAILAAEEFEKLAQINLAMIDWGGQISQERAILYAKLGNGIETIIGAPTIALSNAQEREELLGQLEGVRPTVIGFLAAVGFKTQPQQKWIGKNPGDSLVDLLRTVYAEEFRIANLEE